MNNPIETPMSQRDLIIYTQCWLRAFRISYYSIKESIWLACQYADKNWELYK